MQGVFNGIRHLLMVGVRRQLIAQVRGAAEPLADGLPAVVVTDDYVLSVVFVNGILIIQHALILEVQQVGADLVEAGVQIVAALVGGILAVVPHR